jgi:outer membrane receptor protein involved in Fe transport
MWLPLSRRLSLLSCLALTLWPGLMLNAQSPGLVEVRGTVLSADRQAVEFATVVILRRTDGASVEGSTTDTEGRFALNTTETDFEVEIRYLGFLTRTLPGTGARNGLLDLGEIILYENLQVLDEVVVRTDRSQMEFRLDKRVFNVGSDLSSTGASALEVLNQVPSVTVSMEGQISLRGSQGVQILINGKPSVMASAEGKTLGTITADMIDRIEVITNPSAKYEAEGSSGIINIVLKKEEKKGINGSATLNTGIPHNHSAGLSLNRRTDHFNFFSQLGAGYRSVPTDNRNINRDLNTGTIVRSTGRDFRNEYFYTLILGTDYHINERNVITLSGNYTYELEDQPSRTTFELLDASEVIQSDWVRVEETRATNPKWQYDLQYKRTFSDHKDHVLMISAIGNYFGKDQASEFFNTTLSGARPDARQETRTDFGETRYTFNLDYVWPFSKTLSAEAGLQYQLNDVSNDFAVLDLIGGGWVENPDFTNVFEWRQGVLGAYATGAWEGPRWGLKGGLRVEQTDLFTRLEQTGETNDRNFTNLFPSLHSSYKFTERLQVQAGYSRRIFRPRLWDLNPFFNIRNDFTIRAGNPDLQPQFTDALELTTIYIAGKWSANAGLYYRYTTDVVERVLNVVDNVNLSRPENIGTDATTGIEVNGKYSPLDWFSLNADFNYNLFRQRGEFRGDNFDFDANRWFSRLVARLKLPMNMETEITWEHQSGYRTLQQQLSPFSLVNLGVRKKFLRGKAVVNLSVRDLFITRIQESLASQPDFNVYGWSRRGRFVTLGFSYGFGKGEAMVFSGGRR